MLFWWHRSKRIRDGLLLNHVPRLIAQIEAVTRWCIAFDLRKHEDSDVNAIELKIKVKNLAEEARIIRKEEAKVHGMEKWQLQHHRKTVVRAAARRTQLAYQICRGRDWRPCCSHNRFTRMSDFSEVCRMVKKYGKAEAINSLPQVEAAMKLSLSGDHEDAKDACSNAA